MGHIDYGAGHLRPLQIQRATSARSIHHFTRGFSTMAIQSRDRTPVAFASRGEIFRPDLSIKGLFGADFIEIKEQTYGWLKAGL